MPNIPPLPVRTKTGKCPWCQWQILSAAYGESVPLEHLKFEDGGECPKCHKPIRAHFEEVITHEVKIMAERSETDKRYMAHMGVAEPGDPLVRAYMDRDGTSQADATVLADAVRGILS